MKRFEKRSPLGDRENECQNRNFENTELQIRMPEYINDHIDVDRRPRVMCLIWPYTDLGASLNAAPFANKTIKLAGGFCGGYKSNAI